MIFDAEGHIHIAPKEVHALALTDPGRLIHEALIPGTPWAFPSHLSYCQFLDYFAKELNVPPRNLLLKGSTKIGFSVCPRPQKVWREFSDESDLDLAIIDPHYYDQIDEEVRAWEREPVNKSRMVQDERAKREFLCRKRQRGSYHCLRYFDLPLVTTVTRHNAVLTAAPVQQCCGKPRPLTAFIFRDWWGVFDRYLFDVEELARKLGNPALAMPSGGEMPLPHHSEQPRLAFRL